MPLPRPPDKDRHLSIGDQPPLHVCHLSLINELRLNMEVFTYSCSERNFSQRVSSLERAPPVDADQTLSEFLCFSNLVFGSSDLYIDCDYSNSAI